MATLQENVAARKEARQSGTPIVNAAPAPQPASTPIAVKQVYIQPNPSYNPPVAKPQQDKDYDSRGAGNPVYNDPTQLTDAYTSQEHRRTQLTEQLSGGEITQQDYDKEISQMFTKDQYNSALKNLESGYSGVDPLGFGNTTIKGVEGFDTLEDAQKASEDYYTKYGTSDPRIDAAIYNFQNPEAYKGAASSGTKYAPRTPITRQSATTAKTLEQLNAQEEAAIANARATGGQGYGGDASFAESVIRKQFQGERNKLLKEQELLNKQSEFSASEAERRKTEASMGKDESEFSSAAIPDIDATIQKMTEMANNSMGIKQEVFNAFLPSIQSLAGQIKKVRASADEIDTTAERSALAEEQIAPEKELAMRRENQFNQRLKNDEALLKENRDILVEANRLTTEALDLDKKITQENQRINEVRQMAANVEGEKKLRRSLNAIGIENSPNATAYLQGKIQEAADTLQSMITTNSLTILKYDNGRLQLNNSLRATLNEFDSKRAILNNAFDDNIFNLDQYVSGARSEALKGLKNDWQTLLKEEDKLMMDFGKKIEDATIKGLEMHADAEKLDKQDKLADKRLQSQEDRADARLQMTMNNQERMQMNTDKNAERAASDDIRSQVRTISQNESVKTYNAMRSGVARIKAMSISALKSNDPELIGAMKTMNLTLTAKLSDPTTGVKEGELEKFGKSSTWMNKVNQTIKGILGGDMSGITQESMDAYLEMAELSHEASKNDAILVMQPVISSIITHNNRAQYLPLNPSDILPAEYLTNATEAWNAYSAATERVDNVYNFEWNSESGGGGEFGSDLLSLGRMTQGYDTPIQEGLYSAETVQAWGGIHAGVDIAVPQGAEFESLVDGEIIEVTEAPGWGGTIVIRDSGGAEHRISHLSEISGDILVGENIYKGQVLARTGGALGTKGAGTSTGAHIDYRIRQNGKYIDPLQYNA